MKLTLLDMTQTILSSMDSAAVNSINDTEEAMQVATVIRTVYYDLITRAKLPEHFSEFQLIASGSASKPTLMTVPTTVSEVLWIEYNTETTDDTAMRYTRLSPLPKVSFLKMMYGLVEGDDNVGTFTHTIDGDSMNFLYRDDVAPRFYTSLDDYTIIFDAYDSTVDTTLQGSKTIGYGRRIVPWSMVDTFIPDMDEDHFPLFLNEAKSLAWAELKQMPHQKAEQNARRGWTHLTKAKTTVKLESDFNMLPNFGRKR